MPPAWLQTLFEKWRSARGDKLSPAQRPFTTPWEDLLDEAGLPRVEDRRAAQRDLEKLEQQSRLKGLAHKYRRYLIERVQIPVEAEAWLQETFHHRPATQRHSQSLALVKDYAAKDHPRFPDLWQQWCHHLHHEFEQGRNVLPLMWKAPEETGELLDLVFKFTAKDWGKNMPVRTASSELNLPDGSKGLEPRKAALESCLSSLFGRPVTLESSGIVLSEPKVELVGALVLHFSDGREQSFHALRNPFSLSFLNDLEHVSHITTVASRVLLIENRKTCVPLLAARNDDADTLLVSCSFPNRAVLHLLELLPPDMPLFHFGDTDPAGFLILATLRELSGRHIAPFLMHYRLAKTPVRLTEYDRRILPGLLQNPWLEDVRSELEAMNAAQDKGQFEQETWGIPDLPGWPFYSQAECKPGHPTH